MRALRRLVEPLLKPHQTIVEESNPDFEVLASHCTPERKTQQDKRVDTGVTIEYFSTDDAEIQRVTWPAYYGKARRSIHVYRPPGPKIILGRLAVFTWYGVIFVIGKASPAKAAVGDKPVFAYIASLPQPQRGIAECIDALAAKTLPGLQRSVKWGLSYYGVGDGWCFCCGGFAGHVKLMFVNGAVLVPVPPVTPEAMGKSTRGVELESVDDLDERQIAAWMKQVAAVPGVGGKKR